MQGWTTLPDALLDRICSYACSPVYDTLLSLSSTCLQWRQLVDGEAGGRLNCWRHVHPLIMTPSDYGLHISVGRQSVRMLGAVSVALKDYQSALLYVASDQSHSTSTVNTAPAASASSTSSSRPVLPHILTQTFVCSSIT